MSAQIRGSRRIQRWEHANAVERHRRHMEDNPDLMRLQGALVEHPFGALKHCAEIDHFLMRGLAKCHGKSSLIKLRCNFKRARKIIDVEALMSSCTFISKQVERG